MKDDPVLHEVAGAMVEGRPIDWTSAESNAADARMRRLVRELKVIAEIAEVHGVLSPSNEGRPIGTDTQNPDRVHDLPLLGLRVFA